jgi:hypothetical protein
MLLAGRQWFLTTAEHPAPAPAPAATVAAQPVEVQPEAAEPPPVASPAASARSPVSPAAANTGTFRGKVLDATTRKPLKAFDVQLTRIITEESVTRADASITKSFEAATGRFAWKDLTPSIWSVEVSARGYQHFFIREVKIVAGESTHEILVPLLRGYTVRGRVIERRTGTGIADAWVSFTEAGRHGWRQRASTKSKDDGTFVLDGVAGGEIKLTANAENHAYGEFDVFVDENTPPQEIALSSGGTIAGIVTSPSGAPLRVRIMLSGPYAGYSDETDDRGRFSFKNMPPGRYEVATTDSAGSASQQFVLGLDERKEDIVLSIAAGRTVRGVVRGVRPEQLKRTYLSLYSKSRAAYFSARFDEQGSDTLNGVPPGPAELSVYADGRRLEKQVDVPADRDIVLDIIFPPGARLSGRVTQGGKPATPRNIWMRLADSPTGTLYQARTSEDGAYEIEGVPPGEYRLRADDDISRLIAIAGDAVLNIDIPAVQLGGRVQEDDDTTPIVGADVYVRGNEAATARVRGARESDNLGEFALTGIEPGEITLTVYKPGYEMYREKIAYSSPITNKTITLRKGGGVEVRVLHAAGRQPLRGLLLSEKIPNNDVWIDLRIPLDREGIGHMPSALTGSTLKFYGPGDKEIDIEEWDGQALELKL